MLDLLKNVLFPIIIAVNPAADDSMLSRAPTVAVCFDRATVDVPLSGTLVEEYWRDTIGIEFTYVVDVTDPEFLLMVTLEIYEDMHEDPWDSNMVPTWTFDVPPVPSEDTLVLRAWRAALYHAMVAEAMAAILDEATEWYPKLSNLRRKAPDVETVRHKDFLTPYGIVTMFMRPLAKR